MNRILGSVGSFHRTKRERESKTLFLDTDAKMPDHQSCQCMRYNTYKLAKKTCLTPHSFTNNRMELDLAVPRCAQVLSRAICSGHVKGMCLYEREKTLLSSSSLVLQHVHSKRNKRGNCSLCFDFYA